MEIIINPSKIYTKSEYSRAYNISRPTLDRMIESKIIKSLKVKGATLVISK